MLTWSNWQPVSMVKGRKNIYKNKRKMLRSQTECSQTLHISLWDFSFCGGEKKMLAETICASQTRSTEVWHLRNRCHVKHAWQGQAELSQSKHYKWLTNYATIFLTAAFSDTLFSIVEIDTLRLKTTKTDNMTEEAGGPKILLWKRLYSKILPLIYPFPELADLCTRNRLIKSLVRNTPA